MTPSPIGLFEGFGIELEYMIVESDTLAVKPIAEVLLSTDDGIQSEVEHGTLAWCNELVAHVIELKTNGPTKAINTQLLGAFTDDIRTINQNLGKFGARLMPTAMHPTMDPNSETTLWPHEYNEVYHTFDTIFDCSGHGWANLQSTHINLPFANEAEFARLHAAIRFVLPIIPALSASSPIVDGAVTGWMDTRLNVYSNNASSVPSVMGLVVPEPVESYSDYQRHILQPIYDDLAPHDPHGVLRHEWVNARGAITRFDRQAIEIRVIDVQECPRADLAIAAAVIATVKAFTNSTPSRTSQLNSLPTAQLKKILMDTARTAEETIVQDQAYLGLFGLRAPATARDVWRHALTNVCDDDPMLDPWEDTLNFILEHGCLARRVVRSLGNQPPGASIATFKALSECLDQGRMFAGQS